MLNVPDAWCNHLRGDAFHDARGHYFKPPPEQVRQKYHEFVPMLGFQPSLDAARLRRGIGNERDARRAILTDELTKMRALQAKQVDARCAGDWWMPTLTNWSCREVGRVKPVLMF